MKRTQQIVLVLSGALTAGGLTGCSRGDRPVPPPQAGPGINYTNNQYVQGVGYFHAPSHAWFLLPYNYYDVSRGWYRGGRWYTSPVMDSGSSSWSSGGSHFFSGSSWGSSGGGGDSGGSVSRGGFGRSGGGSGGSS